MLIQSDPKTGEPLLLSTSLPDSLHSQAEAKTKQVFLLDSQMGTGAAARESSCTLLQVKLTTVMAVRVLLDHGVPGEYPSSSSRSLDSAAHGGAQRDRVVVRVCVHA